MGIFLRFSPAWFKNVRVVCRTVEPCLYITHSRVSESLSVVESSVELCLYHTPYICVCLYCWAQFRAMFISHTPVYLSLSVLLTAAPYSLLYTLGCMFCQRPWWGALLLTVYCSVVGLGYWTSRTYVFPLLSCGWFSTLRCCVWRHCKLCLCLCVCMCVCLECAAETPVIATTSIESCAVPMMVLFSIAVCSCLCSLHSCALLLPVCVTCRDEFGYQVKIGFHNCFLVFLWDHNSS